MIRAVFFDWGNTLVAWKFDPRAVRRGARARALPPSEPERRRNRHFTAAYSRGCCRSSSASGEDEVDYTAEIGALLGSLGADGDRDAR